VSQEYWLSIQNKKNFKKNHVTIIWSKVTPYVSRQNFYLWIP